MSWQGIHKKMYVRGQSVMVVLAVVGPRHRSGYSARGTLPCRAPRQARYQKALVEFVQPKGDHERVSQYVEL